MFILIISGDKEILVLIPKMQKTKMDELANSVDPDEVAHNEPPHLDLHCLPSSL